MFALGCIEISSELRTTAKGYERDIDAYRGSRHHLDDRGRFTMVLAGGKRSNNSRFERDTKERAIFDVSPDVDERAAHHVVFDTRSASTSMKDDYFAKNLYHNENAAPYAKKFAFIPVFCHQ